MSYSITIPGTLENWVVIPSKKINPKWIISIVLTIQYEVAITEAIKNEKS
jgi:hypothetical protein